MFIPAPITVALSKIKFNFRVILIINETHSIYY